MCYTLLLLFNTCVNWPLQAPLTEAGGRLIVAQSPYPNPESPSGLRSERYYYDGIRRIQEVVSDALLSQDDSAASGEPELMMAAQGEAFDLNTFVRGMNTRLEGVGFESITGPTFDMPVHVFCLTREA